MREFNHTIGGKEPIIDIWQTHLDISPEEEKAHWSILNDKERERSNRFVKPEHQTRFLAGRGKLRSILAHYLNVAPQNIKFTYLPQGKPILANCHQTCLEFNVSHSHNLALYAISESNQAVGIDLEIIRPISSVLSLAQRFFTPKEVAYITALPPHQQTVTFLQFWTAKEAYLKATGEGLKGLQNIELTISATDSNQFDIVSNQEEIKLYSFTPQPNYIATVASFGVTRPMINFVL